MAANDTITLAAGTWTLITSNNVTTMRIQNCGLNNVFVQATVGTVPPISTNGSIEIIGGQIIPADLDLATLFPGVIGGNRVYAYSVGGGRVSVSHA